MTLKQRLKIKSSIIDSNNWLDSIFSVFDSLNNELTLGHRLMDIFPDWIFFHKVHYRNSKNYNFHLCDLNSITLKELLDNKAAIVIYNTSVKSNNVTTSVAHIHLYNNSIRKTVHHAINITSMKVGLVALRCRINQAVHIPSILLSSQM